MIIVLANFIFFVILVLDSLLLRVTIIHEKKN